MSGSVWNDKERTDNVIAGLAQGGGFKPLAEQGAQGLAPVPQPNWVATQPEGIVTCRASTSSGLRVTGVSKSIGYNLSHLQSWAKGNRHNFPNVSCRDARQFLGAVSYAHQESQFTGKRSAFHCAEVNAVTLLLGKGAGLNEITLNLPTQSNRSANEYINTCPACQQWIADLKIKVVDKI